MTAHRLLLLALLLPLAAFAARDDEDDPRPKAVEEAPLQLPPYPKADRLLAFPVSSATDNRFSIDADSISVGKDGVVRYTLVAQSPSGASNVSYEGMRCGSREIKAYAFGKGDGTWTKARASDWRPIRHEDRNNQHQTLADFFFCPGRIMVRSPDEAVRALKRGSHPRAEHY